MKHCRLFSNSLYIIWVGYWLNSEHRLHLHLHTLEIGCTGKKLQPYLAAYGGL